MPKATKSKATTQPSKPVLSSVEKAARRAHTTEYKNAKASTVESALKGPRYHDEDDEDGGDGEGDGTGEGKGKGSGEEDGNGEEEEDENANEFVEFEAPKRTCPVRSIMCANHSIHSQSRLTSQNAANLSIYPMKLANTPSFQYLNGHKEN
jgi:hypothetical protein